VKLLATVLVLVAMSPAAFAQSPPATTPNRFTVPFEYFTLPNGLKVVVSEQRSSPVVFVEVMYNIGFRIEPKGRTGFAHLFEHMMFQGSAQAKKMEHVSLIQQAGGVVNGSTRLDYTNYFQILPSNALELALWLEADRMRSLDVTAENLKNQQNVVSEEVRVNVLNQPHALFEWLDIWQRANTNWYNAHNFYGDLADLEAATLEDVQAFFKTYYAPNNAVLSIVGDTSAAEVRALAEKHFGNIPRQDVPRMPDISEPPQKEEKRFTREDKLARTPALAVAWHLPERMTKDFFALSVLDPLIVGDESARLYQKLVRQDRLAMSVQGAFNFLGNNWDVMGPMLFTLRVDYLNDKAASQVLDAIESVLADVRSQGITEVELAQAKTAMRSAFLEELEGGFMPHFGRANLLAAFALFDNDPGRINTILDSIDKVTVADVKAAASRWLVPTNQTSIDSRPAGQTTKGGAQ
jgi:zinc protease